MDFPYLPTDLTSKCSALIERILKVRKLNLVANIVNKETFCLAACHKDLFEILGGAVACFRLSLILLVVAALLVAGSYFSVYLLLGLGPSILVERYLARQERKQYLCVGSIDFQEKNPL